MVGKHIATLKEKKNLAGDNWLFSFEFDERFDYQAGQYLSLKVSEEGDRRSYSIASRPNDKLVDLMIDVSPMGLGSKYALNLNVGDKIEALCPMGGFVVEESKTQNLEESNMLFVATGSGIVPMKPIIEDLLIDKKYQGKVQLIWGMRHMAELYWVDEFKQLEKDFPNFEFKLVLSQAEGDWGGHKGHVGDVFDESYNEWSAYICGNKTMIAETVARLEGLGIKKENIHFEKFY